MKLIKIKEENGGGFLEVHKNDNGLFFLFGSEDGGQRNFYEMTVSMPSAKEFVECLNSQLSLYGLDENTSH